MPETMFRKDGDDCVLTPKEVEQITLSLKETWDPTQLTIVRPGGREIDIQCGCAIDFSYRA